MFDQLTNALTEIAKNFGPKKRYGLDQSESPQILNISQQLLASIP